MSTGCSYNRAILEALQGAAQDGELRLRIASGLAEIVERRAGSLGISVSEYTRRALVVQLLADRAREEAARIRAAGAGELFTAVNEEGEA